MDSIKKLNLKVNKKVLMIIGGIVWTFAGTRVFSLGYSDVKSTNIIGVLMSIIVFAVFFNFIFYKMAKKHVKRIDSKDKQKLCVFSFFDIKGYIIMTFMMTFGITLRNTGIINPNYLGLFYIGLGFALSLGGIIFLLSGINYKR